MGDTIFALSSGAPPSGIGVIRISGPAAGDAMRALVRVALKPRRATLVTLRAPADDGILDHALALWLPGPGTATGEDVGELHCHGGRAVTSAVLAALGRIKGLRPAVAGEFTRRAFDNGVIDLNEAEGLGDLLLAETESQRRAALAMADGHFSRKIEGWRARLNDVAAMVEAALDFSDEDDVPDNDIDRRIHGEVAQLADVVRAELDRVPVERLRDGVRIVLAGPPNAGKSTLLNALVGRDAAIVSDVPGTTRDRIEAPAAIAGIAMLFTDTAGLRDSDDLIEIAGIDRARAAVEAADIILWLGEPEDTPRQDAICIAAQVDRPGRHAVGDQIGISAMTGTGMAELSATLVKQAKKLLPGEDDYALQARQRAGIARAVAALDLAAGESDMLIVAECLRSARAAFDALTGRAGIEDVLDSLFGRFCIGK